MITALRVVLVLAASVAATLTGVGTAHAESYAAPCYARDAGNTCYGSPTATSGLELAARARYTDETNDLCVADKQPDGRSSVGIYWPEGQPGKKVQLWNHSGDGWTICWPLDRLRENAHYRIQACLGEWAPRPANRKIISCGPSRAVLL